MANAPEESAESVGALLVQDERLARVAERMLGANAFLCRHVMPLTGMVIHSQDQYPVETAQSLFTNGRISVAVLLPDSAADRAGIQAGEAVTAIEDRRTDSLSTEEGVPLRDAAFDALSAAWTEGPLTLTIARSGAERQVVLEPAPACRALVEVRTRDSLAARSDGRVIQVDQGLIQAATDEELAVIFAHELAHLVLEHRRRLDAAGVEKGFFGEFGRNQRLNRQMEVEADRLSVHLLANAGYDPQLAPDFWRGRLARRASGALQLSTIYPSAKSRAQLIEREIEDYLPLRAGPTWPGHLLSRREEDTAPP
jgi:hypothetical protein